MNKELVSIIIPCYNVEEYIEECLDSALSQTYHPIEIIAVDNNSTDKTISIIKKYEAEHPDLISILFEPKQGASAARNKGMKFAKGEWLQFLDADDLLKTNKIQRQVEIAQNNRECLLIVGGYQLLHVDGSIDDCPVNINENPLFSVVASRLGYTSSNLFRRQNPANQIFWDEKLMVSEDAKFIYSYFIKSNENLIYDNSMNLIKKDRVSGQLSKSKDIEAFKSNIKFQRWIGAEIKVNWKNFYKNNAIFLTNALYYSIYASALNYPDFGKKKLSLVMPKDFCPTVINDYHISWIHVFGYRLLGFSKYVFVRRCIKSLLNI